jgi:cystathionine gamma-lyase
MDGLYGDSTRSVKAVGSEPIPGIPVAPLPVPASTYHLSSDESEPIDK